MNLEELGRAWIEAWNSRDLEEVLVLYDDEAEMASASIVKLGFSKNGLLKGKNELRAYWARGLQNLPNLHFMLLDVSVSPDSVVVRYVNDRGSTVCEYLRLNQAGRIVQGSANHLMTA